MSLQAEEEFGRELLSNTTYNPTYQLGPAPGAKFSSSAVAKVMQDVMDERLKDYKYVASEAAAVAKEVSRLIQDRVKLMGYDRYKLVTQVIIAENQGQGLRVGSRCLWDPENDNCTTATVKTVRVEI